jgi:hypothetical protein
MLSRLGSPQMDEQAVQVDALQQIPDETRFDRRVGIADERNVRAVCGKCLSAPAR